MREAAKHRGDGRVHTQSPEVHLLTDALKPGAAWGAGPCADPSRCLRVHSDAVPEAEGLHREQEEACQKVVGEVLGCKGKGDTGGKQQPAQVDSQPAGQGAAAVSTGAWGDNCCAYAAGPGTSTHQDVASQTFK